MLDGSGTSAPATTMDTAACGCGDIGEKLFVCRLDGKTVDGDCVTFATSMGTRTAALGAPSSAPSIHVQVAMSAKLAPRGEDTARFAKVASAEAEPVVTGPLVEATVVDEASSATPAPPGTEATHVTAPASGSSGASAPPGNCMLTSACGGGESSAPGSAMAGACEKVAMSAGTVMGADASATLPGASCAGQEQLATRRKDVLSEPDTKVDAKEAAPVASIVALAEPAATRLPGAAASEHASW